MTAEEHIRTMLGAKDFQIAQLAASLDAANEKIKELESARAEKPAND